MSCQRAPCTFWFGPRHAVAVAVGGSGARQHQIFPFSGRDSVSSAGVPARVSARHTAPGTRASRLKLEKVYVILFGSGTAMWRRRLLPPHHLTPPPPPSFPGLPTGRHVRMHPVRVLQHVVPKSLVELGQVPGTRCSDAGSPVDAGQPGACAAGSIGLLGAGHACRARRVRRARRRPACSVAAPAPSFPRPAGTGQVMPARPCCRRPLSSTRPLV